MMWNYPTFRERGKQAPLRRTAGSAASEPDAVEIAKGGGVHGGVDGWIAAREDVALGDFADAGDGFQFVDGGEAARGKIGQGASRGKRDCERLVGGVHSRKIETEV